jgi:hypothetical protein
MMKNFFIAIGAFGVLFFALVIFFPRPFPTASNQYAEIQKSIDENGIKLQELEQDCWDIQRDVYYMIVKLWVIDTIEQHKSFEFSPVVGSIDFSPVNNWDALTDAWKPWLQQQKTKVREVSNSA